VQAGVKLALVTALLALAAAGSAAAAQSPLVGKGKALYGQYCAVCHGGNGDGIRKPRAAGYGPSRETRPERGAGPSLHDSGAEAADFYLTTGYMPLPRLGVQPKRRKRLLLGDAQIRALTAYVASLGKGPPIPHPDPARGSVAVGMQLFTQHCAGCHQIVAQGGYVTGAIAPPLGEASARQIAEAVRIGPWIMPAFSEKLISNRQLDSLVAYVQYARNPDDRGGWAIGRIGPVPEGIVSWFVAGFALVATCMVIGRRARRS
jgi:ubiquinol-cytochrome c reductase cytochrome c subunit